MSHATPHTPWADARAAPRWAPLRRSQSAVRAASAEIVSAGLAEPWVGSTLPSQTSRLGTSQVRHQLIDHRIAAA